jgi:hypothetical protein
MLLSRIFPEVPDIGFGVVVVVNPGLLFIGQSVGSALNGKWIQWIDITEIIVLGAIGVLLISLNFSRLRRSWNPSVR